MDDASLSHALTAAWKEAGDAERDVRSARQALTMAEHYERDSLKAVGAVVRQVRSALGIPAREVASAALGFFSPSESLTKYIEFEDGIASYPRHEVEKIVKWLTARAQSQSDATA